MKQIILAIIIVLMLTTPVSAMEFTAPEAPDGTLEFNPDVNSFGSDVWFVFKSAMNAILPDISSSAGACFSVIGIILLTSILQVFKGGVKHVVDVTGSLGIGLLLINNANSLIQLGIATVTELSDYGRLLLPVMTAALAAQGGASSSASLYIGTATFNAVLTTLISKILTPLLYIFICLSIASSVIKETSIKNLKDFCKWLITWSLKIILYVFTGYMSITGVVSGSTDAVAVKAAKLTISGAVPVVGNILSDASEAILVSAGVMKNAAGAYGLLAIIALFVGPFLKIGVQYLLLKVTAAVCAAFSSKAASKCMWAGRWATASTPIPPRLSGPWRTNLSPPSMNTASWWPWAPAPPPSPPPPVRSAPAAPSPSTTPRPLPKAPTVFLWRPGAAPRHSALPRRRQVPMSLPWTAATGP